MPLSTALDRILAAALAAVEPRSATVRALRRYGDVLALPRGGEGKVWLAGAGKAAVGMAQGALDVVEAIAGGTLAVPAAARCELPGVTLWGAGHPTPTAHSLAAGADALALARGAGPNDVVLCLLSGGASAMWACPPEGVALSDLAEATRALLRAGVPIDDLNVVRRHLSRIAGGGLAAAAAPARVVTLALSDVIGSALETIGSGPAVPDPSTHAQALEIVRAVQGVPVAVLRHLQAGAAGERPETPKPGDPSFEGSSAFVVADNRDALAGAARSAQDWGYPPEVAAEPLAGEAREAASAIARQVRSRAGATGALIYGGETTVTVRGSGRGGRSQELALALAIELRDLPDWYAVAFGTDGVDGETPAAGARVDGGTVARGTAAGVDAAGALAANDSYGFFRREGGALVTGPTGTNVADVVVVLLGGAELGDAVG